MKLLTALVIVISFVLDGAIIYAVFHFYDVVPDRWEYEVCRTTGLGLCNDRGDFKKFQ